MERPRSDQMIRRASVVQDRGDFERVKDERRPIGSPLAGMHTPGIHHSRLRLRKPLHEGRRAVLASHDSQSLGNWSIG